MSILILGAGELGTAILTSLAAHPNHPPLTLLLRPSTLNSSDPAKKAEITNITSLGISLLPGDILQASSQDLTALFKPFHTIMSATGMTFPAGTQTKICQAVLAAGVKRYFPWQYGVDYDIIGRDSSQDLFTEQLDVRDLLRAQTGTAWCILSTGMFMSFLFEEIFGVVTAGYGRVRALGSWNNKVTVTTVEDIGRVVARLACSEPETQGVVHIAGDTISYAELADTVERVTGREVERECWDVDFLKRELQRSPGDGMRKYRVVFAEGRGVAWEVEGTWNKRREMGLMGVEEWLRGRVGR
ncbi:hypothetical protein ACLMJK_009141 [Lecanora helva]